jgi:hypothetical protein
MVYVNLALIAIQTHHSGLPRWALAPSRWDRQAELPPFRGLYTEDPIGIMTMNRPLTGALEAPERVAAR